MQARKMTEAEWLGSWQCPAKQWLMLRPRKFNWPDIRSGLYDPVALEKEFQRRADYQVPRETFDSWQTYGLEDT